MPSLDSRIPFDAAVATSVSSNKGACRSAACQLKLERTKAFVRSIGRVQGMEHVMLGNSSSWRGWRWMSTLYQEQADVIGHTQPSRLMLALDSSDGIIQADSAADVASTYEQVVSSEPAKGRPLVMALETGCVAGFCVPIPSLQSPAVPGNIHVNGGFVMGPARLMKILWHAVATTNISCCHRGRMHPQLGMGRFALQHPELVAFDVHQRLAAIINLRDPEEWHNHYQATNGIVTNRHTGIKPIFVHFPGQQFPGAWNTYREAILLPRGLLSPGFLAQMASPPASTAVAKRGKPQLLHAPSTKHTAWRTRGERASPSWPVVRASSCSITSGRVIFMFTSIPHRSSRLRLMVDNMRAQSRRPDALLLAIPRTYIRRPFDSLPFQLETSVLQDPMLRVVHLEHDSGPLSKYLGSSMLSSTDIVVVGDDDMTYGSTFIEDFACAVASSPPGVVFSSGRDNSCGDLGACVMGFRGVGLRAGMLNALANVSIPSECFLADDVLITHYFQLQQFVIKKLRTRTKYKIDDAYAWSNDSINTIHKRHHYQMNQACVATLLQQQQHPRHELNEK